MIVELSKGQTTTLDVSPSRLSRVRALSGDSLLIDDMVIAAPGEWFPRRLQRLVAVSAIGDDAVVEYDGIFGG